LTVAVRRRREHFDLLVEGTLVEYGKTKRSITLRLTK
jgi:hypothetical protein